MQNFAARPNGWRRRRPGASLRRFFEANLPTRQWQPAVGLNSRETSAQRDYSSRTRGAQCVRLYFWMTDKILDSQAGDQASKSCQGACLF
jgi:hypothetical protein